MGLSSEFYFIAAGRILFQYHYGQFRIPVLIRYKEKKTGCSQITDTFKRSFWNKQSIGKGPAQRLQGYRKCQKRLNN